MGPQSCTPKPPSCTGNLADRSPFGVYTANNVPTPFDSHFVTHVELNFTTSVTPNFHDVTYELDVTGCVFDPTASNGAQRRTTLCCTSQRSAVSGRSGLRTRPTARFSGHRCCTPPCRPTPAQASDILLHQQNVRHR